MILHDFDYQRPGTLGEALALLEGYGDKASPLAGGTDLVLEMSFRSILRRMCEATADGSPAGCSSLLAGFYWIPAETVWSISAMGETRRQQWCRRGERGGVDLGTMYTQFDVWPASC